MIDLTKAIPHCRCATVDDEPVPELPCVKRCKHCKAWTVMEIITKADSDALNRVFAK